MINSDELFQRRKKLMEKLGNGVFILASMPESTYANDVNYIYRPHSNMIYFTGFPEPDTTLIVEKNNENLISHLFVPKRDPKFETWMGRRYGVKGALDIFKVDKAYENEKLEEKLTEILTNYDTVFYEADYNDETDTIVKKSIKNVMSSKDLEGTGPVNVINPVNTVHELRVVKSEYEIKLLRKAAIITADAHTRAMSVTKPGLNEGQIEGIINYEFRKNGASTFAYPSIVGSGVNGTILHYIVNSDELKDGDLLLVDAGCEYNGYAADITRTWPVNGKFSDAQRIIYQLVLDVQKACINMAKPGAKFWDLHEMSVKLITEGLVKIGLLEGEVDKLIKEEEYKKFYMHGLGHWLGIDTHDTGMVKRKIVNLEIGNYFTVEPGIYIPDHEDIPERFRGIGVRIEDDILITENGNEVLTKNVVKEIDEIEKLVNTQDLP